MRMHDASVLFDPKPLQPTPHGQQPGQQQQQQQPQSTERKVAAFKFLFVEHYLSLLTYRHRRVQRMDRFREDLARRQVRFSLVSVWLSPYTHMYYVDGRGGGSSSPAKQVPPRV